jgi:chemotaxis protein methyltransferase WspC
MGMMCNATGDLADATANFRKALYLDANDLESLIHLAFLAEKQGDVASARVLRSRMRRLEVTDGH